MVTYSTFYPTRSLKCGSKINHIESFLTDSLASCSPLMAIDMGRGNCGVSAKVLQANDSPFSSHPLTATSWVLMMHQPVPHTWYIKGWTTGNCHFCRSKTVQFEQFPMIQLNKCYLIFEVTLRWALLPQPSRRRKLRLSVVKGDSTRMWSLEVTSALSRAGTLWLHHWAGLDGPSVCLKRCPSSESLHFWYHICYQSQLYVDVYAR